MKLEPALVWRTSVIPPESAGLKVREGAGLTGGRCRDANMEAVWCRLSVLKLLSHTLSACHAFCVYLFTLDSFCSLHPLEVLPVLLHLFMCILQLHAFPKSQLVL